MNYKRYITFLLLFLACSLNRLSAQRIKAEVNRTRIFIGEQILLKLSVEQARPGIKWFNFPDSLNHIEVVSRSKIDTISKANSTTYVQVVALTSFDSGSWQFPGLAIAGLNQITVPISIDVLPVDVSQLKDYHEIKEIEEVQPETNWLIIGLIALATIISIAMVYWLWKKKKTAIITKPVLKGNLSPLEWALAEIKKLDSRSDLSAAETKKYYSDLNNISRQFFEMQMQQQALQKTTDEWMIDLQSLQIDNTVKTSFFQFLRMADTVRFAKYLPPTYENVASSQVVSEMVQRAALLHSPLYNNYQPK